MRSKLADKYLVGLNGIEIGGSAHNSFGLNTINVDRVSHTDNLFDVYKNEQVRICGTFMDVDVVSDGDNLPFSDKSCDFVISSHVIEHFYNPIKALLEWNRVASKYIFIICPHMDRTFDRDKKETTLQECVGRKDEDNSKHTDDHHTFWRLKNFLELLEYLNMDVIEFSDVDDKVGNGFMVLIKTK